MAIILNSPPGPPHQLMAINGNIIVHCNFMIKNNNHIPDLFLSSLIATQLWAEHSQLSLVTCYLLQLHRNLRATGPSGNAGPT